MRRDGEGSFSRSTRYGYGFFASANILGYAEVDSKDAQSPSLTRTMYLVHI
jgi:hypothetical protein